MLSAGGLDAGFFDKTRANLHEITYIRIHIYIWTIIYIDWCNSSAVCSVLEIACFIYRNKSTSLDASIQDNQMIN